MARLPKKSVSKSGRGIKARGRPAAKKRLGSRKEKPAAARKTVSKTVASRKRATAKTTAPRSPASASKSRRGSKVRGRAAKAASRATKTTSKSASASRKPRTAPTKRRGRPQRRTQASLLLLPIQSPTRWLWGRKLWPGLFKPEVRLSRLPPTWQRVPRGLRQR